MNVKDHVMNAIPESGMHIKEIYEIVAKETGDTSTNTTFRHRVRATVSTLKSTGHIERIDKGVYKKV